MGRSVGAVIGGFLWTFSGVTAVNFALLLTVPDAFQRASENSPPIPTTPMMLLLVPVYALCGMLGGYVAAFVARRAELLHGLGVTGLMAALGAVTLGQLYGQVPTGYLLASTAAWVLSPTLGGWIRSRQTRPGAPQP
jgi:hypothetical protein